MSCSWSGNLPVIVVPSSCGARERHYCVFEPQVPAAILTANNAKVKRHLSVPFRQPRVSERSSSISALPAVRWDENFRWRRLFRARSSTICCPHDWGLGPSRRFPEVTLENEVSRQQAHPNQVRSNQIWVQYVDYRLHAVGQAAANASRRSAPTRPTVSVE